MPRTGNRRQKQTEGDIVGQTSNHKMDDDQKPVKEKDNCLKHSIKEEYISDLVQLHGSIGPEGWSGASILKTSSAGPA